MRRRTCPVGMKTPPPPSERMFTFLILSLPPACEMNGISVSTLQMRRWPHRGDNSFNLPVRGKAGTESLARDYTACVLIISSSEQGVCTMWFVAYESREHFSSSWLLLSIFQTPFLCIWKVFKIMSCASPC